MLYGVEILWIDQPLAPNLDRFQPLSKNHLPHSAICHAQPLRRFYCTDDLHWKKYTLTKLSRWRDKRLDKRKSTQHILAHNKSGLASASTLTNPYTADS